MTCEIISRKMDERPPWLKWLTLSPTVSRHVNADKAVDVFQSYRDSLNDAITSDGILRLANALYSKGIISRENLDHAMLIGVLPTEKKVHLFDAIEARIRSHPEDFITFLNILYSDTVYSDLAEKIWEDYMSQVCAVMYVYASDSLCDVELQKFASLLSIQ